MNDTVWAAVVSAGPSTLAAVLSYRSVVHGKENKQAVEAVSQKADRNNEALGRVEHATNGMMTGRIREVVRDELIRHSQNTEEMRELMDAIFRNARDTDEI